MKLNPKEWTTFDVCTLALLLALQIVLSRMLSLHLPAFGLGEGLRIGFGHIPLMLIGILFGPAAGFVVGIASDLIGFWFNPSMAFNPLFTLASGIGGILPGLVFMFTSQIYSWQNLAVTALFTCVKNMFMTPLLLHVSYQVPYKASIPPRLIIWSIQWPITTLLLLVILRALLRVPAFHKTKAAVRH